MELLYLLPGAFLAPVIHEWVRAYTSTRLGDPTPRNRGWLTWNLFKYVEPIGMVLILFTGFGWGMPVPVAPTYYKNRRRDTLLVYTMPSVVNLVLGVAVLVGVSLFAGVLPGILAMILFSFAQTNVLLALFNLLPVYPLDMNKIVQLYAKPDTVIRLNHHEKLLQLVLLLLLMVGLVGRVFYPVWLAIVRIVWLG